MMRSDIAVLADLPQLLLLFSDVEMSGPVFYEEKPKGIKFCIVV